MSWLGLTTPKDPKYALSGAFWPGLHCAPLDFRLLVCAPLTFPSLFTAWPPPIPPHISTGAQEQGPQRRNAPHKTRTIMLCKAFLGSLFSAVLPVLHLARLARAPTRSDYYALLRRIGSSPGFALLCGALQRCTRRNIKTKRR